VLGASLIFVCVGCHPKAKNAQASLTDATQAPGNGVRMALRALSAKEFPEISFAEFMGRGAIGAPQIDVSGTLPGRLLETFSPTLNVQVYPLQGGAIRRETLSINSRFSNSRVVQAGMALTLSPQLSAGAKIEVARSFRDSSQAAHAMPFNIMLLPFEAENALALAEGTYVGVPIEGTVALNVDGNFLSRNGNSDARLFEFLRAGASGSLSGTMQGSLLATGKWRMQILRMAGNLVRVRVVEDDSASASLRASVSVQSALSLTFIPFGVAARALDISQRVINNVRAINGKVSDLQRYTKVPVLSLPAPLRKAKELASLLPTITDEGGRRIDDGIRLADSAVDMARQGSASLQQTIDNAVMNDVRNIQSQVMQKVEAVDNFTSRITNYTYNANAAIKLGADFARKHRFVADYVFDLSRPESKIAYNHAVSGRSLWLGALPNGLNMGAGLSNFTVAERLASEDTNLPGARVVRNMLGESTQQSRSLSLQFSGLMSSTGFTESWKNNTVWARDASGQTESWRAALWQFERDLKIVRNSESERLGSGILVSNNTPAANTELGTYWFAWKRRIAEANSSGMQSIFTDTLNYVGPFGSVYNLEKLYKGEFFGDKEASLLVLFSQKAMQSMFDKNVVTNDILWKALGNVALTFNNSFGLPYNTFGGLPGEYSNSPAAQAACETVSKAWGGAYCAFFANEFLAQLDAARNSQDQWQRMKVFESFYTKGFLANRIGARILVRYLLEVAALTYGKDASQYVAIQFFVRNSKDTSAYASPSFVSANPDEIQVLQTIGMMM
jgi:hypothetical protein